MPKTSIDFSQNVIYKLCCKDIDITDIYIGRTTDIIRRRNEHKSTCNNENNKKHNLYVYEFIRNNGGWSNWELIPIEKYPCNDVMEASIREKYWFNELRATLNNQHPSRTKKEYREENKETISEKGKEYHNKHEEIINEKRREYYENNKERKQEYYQNNKEKKSQKNNCDCGGCYTNEHKNKHLGTKKHQDYVKNLN